MRNELIKILLIISIASFFLVRLNKPAFSNPDSEISSTSLKETNSSNGFSPFNPPSFARDKNIFLLLILSFLAGVLSFLSPCTLPILPAYFAVTFAVERKKIIVMSLSFVLGLATVFMLMGASASFLGKILREKLYLLTQLGGILIICFGLITLIGKGFGGINFKRRPSTSLLGSFFFGSTFALGWTPCIGPILAGILILAATNKTVFQGMFLLFFYALGLGLPLIIISTFFGVLEKQTLLGKILKGKGWEMKIGRRSLYLHSTNLISGSLLIGLGLLLATGYLTVLNSYIPANFQLWFENLEKKLIGII